MNELSRLLELPEAEKAKRGLVHTPGEIAHQPDTWSKTFELFLSQGVAATTIEQILFGPDWPGAAAWTEKWRAMTAPNLLSAFDALARRDDISNKISSIDVPTLVIHGDADAAIPLAKAQAMKEAIPRAKLVVVRGGHSVSMTNPDPVNAALSDFFEQHDLAP